MSKDQDLKTFVLDPAINEMYQRMTQQLVADYNTRYGMDTVKIVQGGNEKSEMVVSIQEWETIRRIQRQSRSWHGSSQIMPIVDRHVLGFPMATSDVFAEMRGTQIEIHRMPSDEQRWRLAVEEEAFQTVLKSRHKVDVTADGTVTVVSACGTRTMVMDAEGKVAVRENAALAKAETMGRDLYPDGFYRASIRHIESTPRNVFVLTDRDLRRDCRGATDPQNWMFKSSAGDQFLGADRVEYHARDGRIKVLKCRRTNDATTNGGWLPEKPTTFWDPDALSGCGDESTGVFPKSRQEIMESFTGVLSHFGPPDSLSNESLKIATEKIIKPIQAAIGLSPDKVAESTPTGFGLGRTNLLIGKPETVARAPDKIHCQHEPIGSGVPGGKTWCKHCDKDLT